MFERLAATKIAEHLSWSPAVAILGPRQVGKTTLAQTFASDPQSAMYLDLDSASARARLTNPEAFFAANRHRLVVLDEIQNQPELLQELRGEIDQDRRPGRFLILGSASFKLLKQSQSLAGRLSLVDLSPLLASEAAPHFADLQTLWLRGGFPNSLLAPSDAASWDWRDAFIRHFLNTDLAQLGINVEPELMRRFWRMLAHQHGQLFNASSIAMSLGVASSTTTRYLDHLCNALVVRRLEPHHINIGKRLVKTPKVYVRDSGLLHSLLGIHEVNDLLGHPSTGASWEGLVIEQIAGHLPVGAQLSFYRTAAGAEMDVVVELGQKRMGFEVKFSSAPKVSKGFWQAKADLQLTHTHVVAPVQEGWPLQDDVSVIPVSEIPQRLAALSE
ncbi:MAG: ATP-binding protein [Betaproteobacteria bacterium]|jgi:predicted AAA+ superfamily ATPase|nr:ATP-binding protein [Betaproteobacteria bacterium]NBP43761.1 ATP-binding protein [Betaproteobacteria bacterium]